MEHITVTPEMRSRILHNLSAADLSPKAHAPKVLRLPRLGQYAALAACLALVLFGSFLLKLPQREPAAPAAPVLTSPVVAELPDVRALSERMGFDVPALTDLPFTAESVTCLDTGTGVAELQYAGEGQTAVFRKGPGSDDVSGDFNSYALREILTVNGVNVTLKGSSEADCTLALWSDGGFSCSLSLSEGVPDARWVGILSGLC